MGSKCEVQGAKCEVSLWKGKVWVRSHERYGGITQSSRRDKMSLIFKVQRVQESEVRIYTVVKPEGTRAHESNGTWEAVHDFGTIRQLGNNKIQLEQQEQGQKERQSKRKLGPKCFGNTKVLGVEFGRLRKCPGGLERFWKPQKASGNLGVESAR